MVWPATLWQLPLNAEPKSGQKAPPNLYPAVKRLAKLAESEFNRYEEQLLPKELAADARWSREYEEADSSRQNIGFHRWQKQVYSKTMRFDISQVDWQGSVLPDLPSELYTWREWYSSNDLKELRGRIESVTKQFVVSHRVDVPQRLRTFIWAEVYRYGIGRRPEVHTGAFAQGFIFARHAVGEGGVAQQVVLEDPRGAAAPFGHQKYVNVSLGEMVVLPSWVSHYWTPQPIENQTNVVIGWVSWPYEGMSDFDWEDDPTGDYVFRRQMKLGKTSSKATGRDGSEL